MTSISTRIRLRVRLAYNGRDGGLEQPCRGNDTCKPRNNAAAGRGIRPNGSPQAFTCVYLSYEANEYRGSG